MLGPGLLAAIVSCSSFGSSEGDDPGSTTGDAVDDACIATPTDPACLNDAKAFFVSPQGNDSGEGTKAQPFKTLGAALGKVSSDKKRIYVCEGTYDEDVRLTETHGGVSLIGMTCAWTSPPAAPPKFGKSPLALRIESAKGVAIANLAFEAKDATESGSSSIAAFVANAGVNFSGVSLTAGAGKDGAAGTLQEFQFPDVTELKGNDALDGQVGGAEKPYSMCPGGGITKGGKGGDVGNVGTDGETGQANKGIVSECGSGGTGNAGAAGAQTAPADGAKAHGILTAEAWQSSPGTVGAPGSPGQGGGGGYGTGGAGGGGGAGGCGGAGGGAGTGGGGSIALVSYRSTAKLTTSALTAKSAGAGGAGAAGQPGQQQGGVKGNGSLNACDGGKGGIGGTGGTGGGGAGGVSIGALYTGSPPSLDAATTNAVVTGTKGAPGAGPGNAGIDGVATATLAAE